MVPTTMSMIRCTDAAASTSLRTEPSGCGAERMGRDHRRRVREIE
jgi:hypothetical protein